MFNTTDIEPPYFVNTGKGPTGQESDDCNVFVCRWKRLQDPTGYPGWSIILECHDDDGLKLAAVLNEVDRTGEIF